MASRVLLALALTFPIFQLFSDLGKAGDPLLCERRFGELAGADFRAYHLMRGQVLLSGIRLLRMDRTHEESFDLHVYENEHGQKEVQIRFKTLKKFFPVLSDVLLTGRDLDGDGKFDTWFYRGKDGALHTYSKVSKLSDGWDVASVLLRGRLKNLPEWSASAAIGSLMEKLTVTGGELADEKMKLDRLELDLAELKFRLNKAEQKPGADKSGQAGYLRTLIHLMEDRIQEELNDPHTLKFYGSIAGDFTTLFLAGPILKGAGEAVGAVSREVFASLNQGSLRGMLSRFSETFREGARSVFQRQVAPVTAGLDPLEAAAVRAGEEAAAAETAVLGGAAAQKLLELPVEHQADLMIRALTGFDKAKRLALAGGKGVIETAKAGAGEWRYIALTQSTQVAAEMGVRMDEMKTRDPAEMIKRLFSDPGFLQDFLYMSNETFWMSGINAGVQGTVRKLGYSALLSMVDSTTMNLLVKHQTDLGRIELDTGWEMGIGNLQTLRDFEAMNLFTQLGLRSGIPKLKWVGYGVTLADQAGGYFQYGRVSKHYEQGHEKKKDRPVDLSLVPLFTRE